MDQRRKRERERRLRQKKAALAEHNLAVAQAGTVLQRPPSPNGEEKRPLTDHEIFYGRAPSQSSQSPAASLVSSRTQIKSSTTASSVARAQAAYDGGDVSTSDSDSDREQLLRIAAMKRSSVNKSSTQSHKPAARASSSPLAKANNRFRRESAGMCEDDSSNNSSEEEETPPLMTMPPASKPIRNPLTLEREQLHPTLPVSSAATVNAASASLWEDDDDDNNKNAHNVEGSKMAGGNSPSNPLLNSSALQIKKRKKKKRKTQDGNHRRESLFSSDTIEANDDDGMDELKPTFEWAQFGPFALEPLELRVEAECQYRVPASVARYLPDYQRKGIEFMYKALSSQGGAILGDDMGLGKTIQVLALIAAYLEKTGGKDDLQELKRRDKVYSEYERELTRRRERAIENGTILLDKGDDPEPSFPMKLMSPILIVVPAGVVDNWAEAFRTWGHFGVIMFRGKEKEENLKRISRNLAEIALCPDSVFQQKSSTEMLGTIRWKLLVVDEFHKFKNSTGKLSDHLRALKKAVNCKVLGLTGTVMQNDLKELWNLVDLVKEGICGDHKEFEARYEKPIKFARVKDAKDRVVKFGQERALEMSVKLHGVYMARTKAEVLKDALPEKDEYVILCELSSIQKRIYEHMLSTPDFMLLSQASGPCDCGVNKKYFLEYQRLVGVRNRLDYVRKNKKDIESRAKCCYNVPETARGSGQIDDNAVLWKEEHHGDSESACNKCPYCIFFKAMHLLYKLSSHVALLQAKRPDHCSSEKDREDAARGVARAKVFIPPELHGEIPGGLYRETCITDDHFSMSGKIRYLDRLLSSIEKRCGRVLLFSASTKSLDLIEHYVKSKGYSYRRMDGETETQKRTQLAKEFNSDPSIFVFLLSTKAMGLGLNLTSANNVIIYDVEWNPSYDQQAQDRAYRIGQKQDVKVYRLVSRGTIEEQKLLRQLYKLQLKDEAIVDVNTADSQKIVSRLFRGVEGDKDRRGELFGIANLLKFKDGEFMQYKKQNKLGMQVVDTSTMIEAAQQMSEQHTAEMELMQGFEKNDEMTGEESESAMGGDSQAFMNIGDRVFCPDASTCGENREPPPSLASPSKSVMFEPQAVSPLATTSTPPKPRVSASVAPATHNEAEGANAKACHIESLPTQPRKGKRNYTICSKSRDQLRRQKAGGKSVM